MGSIPAGLFDVAGEKVTTFFGTSILWVSPSSATNYVDTFTGCTQAINFADAVTNGRATATP